jgi:hypothetical protein
LLNEIVLAHTLERREPGNFGVGQAYLSRPAAAGGATLTFVKDRHCVSVTMASLCAKPDVRVQVNGNAARTEWTAPD